MAASCACASSAISVIVATRLIRSGQYDIVIAGGAEQLDWLAALGVTTRVHRTPGEATSLGAAIAAGVGVGLFSDYADAAHVAAVRSTHPVNPQWQSAYKQVYPIYADIYERLRPLNNRIAALNME